MMSSRSSGRRRKPGEDMLGMLVREHGDRSQRPPNSSASGRLLLLAGHETTSNMFEPWHYCAATTPRSTGRSSRRPRCQVGPAIEELLRYLSVVHNAIPRITTSEVEVGGAGHPGRASFS